MLRTVSGIALVAASALALTAALLTIPRASATTACDTATASLDAAEQQMLGLVNDARAAFALPAVTADAILSRSAAWHSEDQASRGQMAHVDSLGRDPLTRIIDCGSLPLQAGENVAYSTAGFDTVSLTFGAWMASEPHRASILTSTFTHAGLGRAVSSNGLEYWTLLLTVGDPGGGAAARETPTPTPGPLPALPLPQLSQRMVVTMLAGGG